MMLGTVEQQQLYCLVLLTVIDLLDLSPSPWQDNPGYEEWLTDIMLIGLAPVLVFGFLVSFFRLRLLQWHALRAIRCVFLCVCVCVCVCVCE